jgi:hypothetical protein
MAALIKLTLVVNLIFNSWFGDGDVPLQKISSYSYKNKPVVVYKSNSANAEFVYKIVLYSNATQNKTEQTLMVRKADVLTKNMMGATYILSEVTTNGQYVNYPYAWETMNITMKDLQEDCVNVFSKSISPLKMN